MNTSIHQEAELWAATAATGGLTETERKAWNDHIATCPACKKLNEEELAMCDLIKGTLDPASPDPGFEQRIIRRLDQARAGRGNLWYDSILFNPVLFAAAACLALAALAGIGLLIRGEKPGSPTAGVQPGLDGLPPAVRSAIQADARGEIVGDVEKDADDGEVSYTIGTKTRDGRESSFTVAADGTLLSVETTLAEVPGAVRDAIHTQVGQERLEGIEEDFEEGEASYVATIAFPDDRERDFTFAKDGTLTEVETSLGELPGSLQAAIKAQVGQGTLEGIDKTFDDGETSYVATITTRDGRERDFTFDEDGTLASVEVSVAELSAPLQAAIKTQVGRGRLDGIDKTFEDGGITYEATMTSPDGRQRDFSLSTQGNLISREVAMNEAPEAVQQTISQTLGKGKVIEINQSFTEPAGKEPYEIEGWINGKPFYFLVSPTGDFLGMED